MKAVVRFWISVLSLLVSVSAVGYLFLSFLFPERAFVFQGQLIRLGVMFVALLGIGSLVWSAVLADSVKDPSSPAKNRNR